MARGEALDSSEFVLTTLRSINQGSVPLGSPIPIRPVFPWAKLNQYANQRGAPRRPDGHHRRPAAGNPELIRQIARRHLENGLPVDVAKSSSPPAPPRRSTCACRRRRRGQRDRGGIAHLLRAAAGDRTNGHAPVEIATDPDQGINGSAGARHP
jgi:hypothetical protein